MGDSRRGGGEGLLGLARQVFLPEGYPQSVSGDYLEYQIWDTAQAFASSVSGSLATAAVLGGLGVGDAAASPLAATITWILKDGAGMVGRIVFAAYTGSGLDYDCKVRHVVVVVVVGVLTVVMSEVEDVC